MSKTGMSRRGFLRASTAAAAGLAASGCTKSAKQAALEEENKALVRRYVEELWNQHNTDLDEYGRIFHKELMSFWPDSKQYIQDIFAEGDKVVYRTTSTATIEFPMFGFPPEGKQVKWSGISIVRIEDGMIAETWNEWDSYVVYEQIGGVPAQKTE